MPVRTRANTGQVYADADRFLAELAARQEAAAQEMLAAWSDRYWGIRQEMENLGAKIEAARAQGLPTSPAWGYQQQRLKSLLDTTKTEIHRYADAVSQITTKAQDAAIRAAAAHAERLARTTLVEQYGVDASFVAPEVTDLLEQAVGFTGDGGTLQAHLRKTLTADATDRIRTTLLHGLGTGKDIPWMVRQVTRDLSLTHSRATTIMRTETQRVYREATRRTYEANADTMEGWVWRAHLDARTCIACAVMDGTLHTLDETLDGHPRCRCAMIPRTKSWEDLGVPGLEDTRPPIRSGKAWLEGQSSSVQQAMMGRAKFNAWQAGDITLDDMVARLHDPAWGTMRTERSLKAIREGRNANWFRRTEPPVPATPAPAPSTPTTSAPPHGIQTGDRVTLSKSPDAAAWEVVRTEDDALWVRSLGGRHNTARTKPTKRVPLDQVQRHGTPTGESNQFGQVYDWKPYTRPTRPAPAPMEAPVAPTPTVAPVDAVRTPQSVLDALEPKPWTTASRAKAVEALKTTPEGRTLQKVLDSFQSGGSTAIPRLRTDIEKYLAGEALPQGRVDTIETLLRAIRDSTTDKELFRGMSLPGTLDDVLARYSAGDRMDLSLASFSSDKKLAQSFTIRGAGQKVATKVNTPVMIEWSGPKSALPIQNLGKSRIFGNEKEWLGSGQFKITSVTKAKRGGVDTVVLKVEQVKPLEVRTGIPARPPIPEPAPATVKAAVENVDALPMPTSPRYSYTALAKFKRDLRGLPDEMVQAQLGKNGDSAVEELIRREIVRREAATPDAVREARVLARREALETADEWQAGLPRIEGVSAARPVVLKDVSPEVLDALRDAPGVRVLVDGPKVNQLAITNHEAAEAALERLAAERREAFTTAFRSGDREATGAARAKMTEVVETREAIAAGKAGSPVPEWTRTNPMYRMGTQYQTNCTHVCTAYELRVRGFDVRASALPDEFLANQGRSWDAIYQRWGAPEGVSMNDQVLLKGTKRTGEKWAKAHGDGTRFTILVRWKDGGAHVFSAEVKDGQVIYHDAQSGMSGISVEGYLDRAKNGTVAWYRMDNMTPNRDLADLLEVTR